MSGSPGLRLKGVLYPPLPPALEDACQFCPNCFCPPHIASNRFKTSNTATATAFQPLLSAFATAFDPSLQPPSASSTAPGLPLVKRRLGGGGGRLSSRHGHHGGGRQPMCDPEGCSTVWGAVGGGNPPPFVDPNPAPFPSGPVQVRKHTKLTRRTVNGDCFAALQHFQSSTECCLEFAQRPFLPLVTNHRHIYREAKGATDIYIEKRREGRGLKHRNHPPTRRVPSCRYSWGEHASLAGLLAIL